MKRRFMMVAVAMITSSGAPLPYNWEVMICADPVKMIQFIENAWHGGASTPDAGFDSGVLS